MNWFDNGKVKEISLFDALQAKRTGIIKLPIYQRDAVWSEGRICALWDSLLRGFPLPSFLLVKGGRTSRDFQNHRLSARGQSADPEQDYYNLLDGQQRMAAIDAISPKSADLIRLWLDLAPERKAHPLKFKYWIHACTKVFPFGFRMEASGEHDFAVLHDSEIATIWDCLQSSPNLKGKEFHDIPLSDTRPFGAGYPVPLTDLIALIHPTVGRFEELSALILDHVKKGEKADLFQRDRRDPDETIVTQVAKGLFRLREYKLSFQLIEWDALEEEDDYTLYERIGRGGVQITPSQLAASKLIMELDRDGNDAVAAFQNSQTLQHLLDTEDVIHALARVAFAETEPKTTSEHETEAHKNSRDLLDLTPQRLNAIQKDRARWDTFIAKLGEYCKSDEGTKVPRLQQAFEQLYTSLRYAENNPHGFSFVQLAQPDKTREGIAPITLHPLLFWFIVRSNGTPIDQQHREEMLRWILFAHGVTSQPKHPKLNREVFRFMVDHEKLNFAGIKTLIFEDPILQKDLGFIWQDPGLENEDVVQRERSWKAIPPPEALISLTWRRLVLQGWVCSGINWFMLLWNQREVMESLYGNIGYIPALFSKGRPFDGDHIVARSRFLYITDKIMNTEVCEGIEWVFSKRQEFGTVIDKKNALADRKYYKLSWKNFRKNLSNSVENYRYWPKRLNRSNGNISVSGKMNTQNVSDLLLGNSLKDAFKEMDDDSLWKWSGIPTEDKDLWLQLPPTKWDEHHIGRFILATLKREHFLYANVFNFLKQ
jgi:Protein of unknown function DUF262